MDNTQIQDKYSKLYANVEKMNTLAQAICDELTQRYIDVQNEIILRGLGSDFQNAKLDLRKDQKGRDLLTLWEDADRRFTIARANLQLAEFNIRWYIACVQAGLA